MSGYSDSDFDDYTVYLSAEAQESLAAYICSSCGSEMTPDENGADTLICLGCGKCKHVNFYDISIGDELCGTVVLHVLGSGKSGVLYLCEYPDYSRCVIKVLKTGMDDDEENIRRFELEAEILGKLDHQNIVHLIEFRKEEHSLCLVMEYVDGYNLQQMVAQEFYFSNETVLEILYCLADTLRYAWENASLLHRDIKPANIMINSDGILKILDFGLSKQCDIDTNLTAAGQALGTPGFMSPEQFRDSRIYDCRSDIFSLGVTIYFLLSGGKLPYDGKTPLAAFQNMVSGKPHLLEEFNSSISPAFSSLVMQMIESDMEKRPASYNEIMRRIEDIANTL